MIIPNTVSRTSSTYNGKTVYELNIVDVLGLEVYNALYTIFPDWFQSLNLGNPSQSYFVQQVQQIATTYKLGGEQIKKFIVRGIVTGDYGPTYSLVSSSPVPKEYPSTFAANASWFLLMSLVATAIVALVVSLFLRYYQHEYSNTQNSFPEILFPFGSELRTRPCKLQN